MKNSLSGIITAFLAGAAVGAILGILYAPDKGSVTRARLKAVGEELGEEFADSFETIRKEFGAGENAPPRKATKPKRGRKPRAAGKKPEA